MDVIDMSEGGGGRESFPLVRHEQTPIKEDFSP